MVNEGQLIALKPVEVQLQNEDGSLKVRKDENGKTVPVKELRQIGDPVPEAELWPNLRAFVSNETVGLAGSTRAIQILASHPHLREKMRAAQDEKVEAPARSKPGPKPGAKKKAAAKAAATKPAPEKEETPESGGADTPDGDGSEA